MLEKMKALEHLSPKTKFIYWIESYIISRKRAMKFASLMNAIEDGAPDAPSDYNEFIKMLTE